MRKKWNEKWCKIEYMAADGGTLKIKESEKSPVLRTKELFIEGNNTDPVTGFPFEALGIFLYHVAAKATSRSLFTRI